MNVYIPDNVPTNCIASWFSPNKKYKIINMGSCGHISWSEVRDDNGRIQLIMFKNCSHLKGHDWRLVCMGVIG